MKKLGNIALFFLIVILAGCAGKQGPVGPTGSQGGPGADDFEMTFQDGVFPTSSYAGTTNTWVDAANPTTAHSGAASLRATMGSAASAYGRVLLKFDLSTMPQNAVVLKAALFLKTEATTSLSGGVTYLIGVNDMDVPAMVSGGCLWNLGANWNFYNGSGSWSTCNYAGIGFVRGYHFVSSPRDTVSF